jgi:hypothetical protein
MSSVYTIHAASLLVVQGELGDDTPMMWWKGQEWPILPGGARFQRKNSTGGFTLDSALQLTVLTAQFGDQLPDSGQSMNYPGQNGKAYTITSVTPAPAGYQMRINADNAAQGL